MKHKYTKQVYLGYDDNKKQIRKWFHADTKADLDRKIAEYKVRMQRTPNTSDVTFGAYSDQWFRTYKANRSKQTQDMYRYALKKCRPIDRYPVRKITRSMCQNVVNDHWEHPSAAEDLVLTMKQVFKCAIADGIIAVSPAEKLCLPKKVVPSYYLLTDDDLKKIEAADLSEQDRFFVTLLRVFGLRPAEALALTPKDFDLDSRTLHINKAMELSNDNRSGVKSTKTGAEREIPIPESLIPLLNERSRVKSGSYLFRKADGGLYTKSAYRRLSERILKAIDIPGVTMYSFRHRRATELFYLCQRGVISTKQAAYLMGHQELVFLKTYSHIDKSKENLDAIYENL